MTDKPNGRMSPAERAVLLDMVKEELPFHLALAPQHAKLRRSKYLALVAEGFTEVQAMEIVKSTPAFEL